MKFDRPTLTPIEPKDPPQKFINFKHFADYYDQKIPCLQQPKFDVQESKKAAEERHFFASYKNNYIKFLNEIEDVIASKSQLLQMLDATDEFYEIINAQLDFAKRYYVVHFNKLNQL